MSLDRLKGELEDLTKWWYYHHNKEMDPVQFVDFQDKFNNMLIRLLSDVVQLKLDEEDEKVKIVLPTGLMLNDKVRSNA